MKASVLALHRRWLNHKKGGVRADCSGKDLHGDDLRGVVLRRANLQGADLEGADLEGADLRWADLRGADLYCAVLRDADLRWAKLPDFQLPKGKLIGYKQVRDGVVLTLKISKERTASLIGNKCRCRSAKVLAANIKGVEFANIKGVGFRSIHDPHFIYRVGETVTVENWSDDIRVECAPGVHFFRTFEEALYYRY